MYRWERRLRDLAHILSVCGQKYFEPDLFRLNTNQFLTTARTVTFLIQKDKHDIPGFDGWYAENISGPWKEDAVMVWAKDSRNQIEKQGDLELNSTMSARLISSYLESEDIVVSLPKPELLRAGVRHLLRFAEKHLPTGIADTAVIKAERRWVANSMPGYELLHAMTYIYGRLHSTCSLLSKHLGGVLAADTPDPTNFDDMYTDDRQVLYVKYRDRVSSHMHVTRVHRDPNYEPPPWVAELRDVAAESTAVGIDQVLDRQAEASRRIFEHDGYHVPMLFLYDKNWKAIDFVTFAPADQAEKYLFSRSVSDRIEYLGAEGLIFICEMWMRDMTRGYPERPMSSLPITGEMLSVSGLDRSGRFVERAWRIVRDDSSSGKPKLEISEHRRGEWAFPNILKPPLAAFERTSSRASMDV